MNCEWISSSFLRKSLYILVHFLENRVLKKVLIYLIEQTSQSHRKYLIYVSSDLSMPILSKVSSHLRGRIGEIRRRLSSPPIPLYSSFVWSHLPERPCPKFRRMTYTIPPTITFFNSRLNNASFSSISHLAIESSTLRIFQHLPSFSGLGISWSYLASLLYLNTFMFEVC